MILEKYIKETQKHEMAVAHKQKLFFNIRLDNISVNTQWFNQSLKVNKINENRLKQQMTETEIKFAQRELKIRRNTRLKELYTEEANRWEQQLAAKGLAVVKDRN